MIGKYRLRQARRFRCGLSSFDLQEGALIEVKQVDTSTNKVLVCFCNRDVDWLHVAVLDLFVKVGG